MRLVLALMLLLPTTVLAAHPVEPTVESEHARAYQDFLAGPSDPNIIRPFAEHVLTTLREIGPSQGCERAYHVIVTIWLLISEGSAGWEGYVSADGTENESTSQKGRALNATAGNLVRWMQEDGCGI